MKKENSGKETIRFASYNIFHGGAANCDISKIAKNITDNNIDIIGIQEVDRGTLRSGGIDILEELSKFSGYPYYAFFKTIDLFTKDVKLSFAQSQKVFFVFLFMFYIIFSE